MRSLLIYLALATFANADDAVSFDPVALERMVRQDCGACHGLTLKGGLGPDIRSGALEGWTAEDLQAIILDGRPGTPMPPWRPLITEAEAAWIAQYLLEHE
ncbi:MAG: cytochrome c [Rhodobacteraceae bacterium]|nr:cytochrome c [Paracoccaceae bacterium]